MDKTNYEEESELQILDEIKRLEISNKDPLRLKYLKQKLKNFNSAFNRWNGG